MDAKKRVAVLDDELDAALPIRALLEASGFSAKEFILVDRFESALEERDDWDAVIIDVFLPAEDGTLKPLGLDLARKIHSEHPNWPIVLISAWADAAKEIEECALQIDGKVAWKPIDSRELVESLNSRFAELED